MSALSCLKQMTKVVADTGNIAEIARYRPEDATTNPSLLLKAVKLPEYDFVLERVVAKNAALAASQGVDEAMLDIAVAFGIEILKLIPGRVSTEVDARLSFDSEKTLAFARRLIEKYQAAGIDRARVLIKIASTWEGIKAAEILEREGIHCNLTLMFDLAQAIACARANITLISPFVGRITDWYRHQAGSDHFPPVSEDKGVLSVKEIFAHYKKFGYQTTVMGASFRHVEQVKALAGCDALTIAPNLLAALEADHAPLKQALDAEKIKKSTKPDASMSEAAFRWAMNQNPMASEKLDEGIRFFAKDTLLLEQIISEKLTGRR